jgi:hypothetical protein
MNAIQIISQDVFDKVRSRFQNLEMGDALGAVTIDPNEARFFDFDFVNEGVNLGRVSISLNDTGSLKVYYSQGITENQDEPAKQLWYNFLREMRLFAMRRLLRFDTRDIAKDNLDKNDFQYLANKSQKDEQQMNMNESRWSPKSTKKTSRAVKGQTEVIVRHHSDVSNMYPGARSQPKKIKAIFIQNHDGERFKYPFIHPAGAFAMAQHVDHGGVPHDPAGKAIVRMSEQIAQLQEFSRHVRTATLHDDATGIVERTSQRLHELKSQIDSLGKRHPYEAWMETFAGEESDDATVLDDVTMEQYKQTFTQTNFKEELSKFFPLIHKIMSETNKINLDQYTIEGKECSKCHCDPCCCDLEESKVDEFAEFEKWADATEQGKLTDDQVDALKNAIAQLQPGELTLKQGGQLAIDFFGEFGLDDSDLEEKLEQAANVDDSTDPIEVFKVWAKESYPELLVTLGMSNTAQQEPVANESTGHPEEFEFPADGRYGYKMGGGDASYGSHGQFNASGLNVYDKVSKKIVSIPDFTYFDEEPDQEELKYWFYNPDGKPMDESEQVQGPVTVCANDGTYEIEKFPSMDDALEYIEAGFRDDPDSQQMDYSIKDSQGNTVWQHNVDHDAGYDAYKERNWTEQDNKEPSKEPNKETNPYPVGYDAYSAKEKMASLKHKSSFFGRTLEDGKESKGMIREIAEMVKQFYNADNESVGPFRSYEGIAIDIGKQISEKYGDEAGTKAESVAKQFMEKLTKQWEAKHGQVPGPVDQHDGLSIDRLKELLGTVKKKVENYSGSSANTNEIGAETTNIMPAFEEMKKLAGLAK